MRVKTTTEPRTGIEREKESMIGLFSIHSLFAVCSLFSVCSRFDLCSLFSFNCFSMTQFPFQVLFVKYIYIYIYIYIDLNC